MIFIRKLLFPISILYGFVTSIRNYFYDNGVIKSKSFDIPVIAVGNLSVGGTGKTPQIEYLIRLLSDKYQIATLSRGYKRKSEGFVLANKTSNAEILGDEPYQFYLKFPNIKVSVDADRTNGITQLLSQKEKPEIILLDDAFQHRKVKAGFYILLTAYNDLYANDFMLPTGNLRESKKGAERANIIIVTKCPKNLSNQSQDALRLKLDLKTYQNIYFTFIDYENNIYGLNEKINISDIKSESKLLLAGIAKPESFFAYLKNENDECLEYPDHHNFSDKDLAIIQNKAGGKKVITTEKDYVRLKESNIISNLYYLPIKTSFIENKDQFDEIVLNYVETKKAPK